MCLWIFSNTIGFLLTDETGNQNITDCLPCSPGMYCSGYGNSFPSGECDAGYFCPEGLSSIMNLVYLSPGSNLSYGSHSAMYKYIHDMKQYFLKLLSSRHTTLPDLQNLLHAMSANFIEKAGTTNYSYVSVVKKSSVTKTTRLFLHENMTQEFMALLPDIALHVFAGSVELILLQVLTHPGRHLWLAHRDTSVRRAHTIRQAVPQGTISHTGREITVIYVL